MKVNFGNLRPTSFVICFTTLSFLVTYSEQCAATSPGTQPTVTTAAPVVTTTAAAGGCRTCTREQITTVMSATFNKAFASDTIDTSGTCAVRTVVCEANSATGTASIAINRSVLSPSVGSRTASFTCNDQAQWVYTQDGASAVVTSMECQPIG